MFTPSMTVFMIDDELAVAEALGLAVGRVEGAEFLGVRKDGPTGLAAAEELQPDIVVLDLRLPGASGLEFYQQLRTRVPGAAVVICTGVVESDIIIEALKLKPDGFVMKPSRLRDFERVVKEVGEGRTAYCDETLDFIRRHRIPELGSQPTLEGGTLSPRELEVLRHFGQRLSAKLIAERMGISVNTVNNHLRSIRRKKGIHDRETLIRVARSLDGARDW